ncbi:stage III sporulation protein AF [Paenibacillus thiaminolyticus]|uniref:stage III sporulation protein AF n=1 Tax=Paenibacillus thiaminolyticus TaxID=49283 RepID=UPI002543A948|nr:stage III sporulation protein AF [Paenibacillus thiaminolyticus]WII35675.1 stage III sporulation protein AF [Paenibacillus thiaminolyticus]
MQWFSQWLKEIIMVILLAAFIDLLLPNRSMQRYVKLMLSLIILLTLLSPVLRLFDSNVTAELAREWDSLLSTSSAKSPEGKTLEQIRREGERLARAREQEALRLAGAQMEASMKEQINRALLQAGAAGSNGGTAVQAAAVHVTLAQDARQGQPAIERIVLTLEEAPAIGQTGAPGPGGPPEPNPVAAIEPVRIEPIEAGSMAGSPPPGTTERAPEEASASGTGSGEHLRLEAAAVGALTSAWLVKPEQIAVSWSPERALPAGAFKR